MTADLPNPLVDGAGLREAKRADRWALAAALVLLGAGPALADDNISITATADVAAVCEFNGQVFPTAGNIAIGEQIAAGQRATSLLNLADSRDQAIGSFRFQCNTPAAAVTITTLNDFNLVNPNGGQGGQIRYLLKIPEIAQLAGGFAVTTAYLDSTGPGASFTERLLLVDVGTLNLFNIAPGFYTDQVILTIQASQ